MGGGGVRRGHGRRGVLDLDTAVPSAITAHVSGHLDRDRELLVGLQTDAPLKRAATQPRSATVRNSPNRYGHRN
ncbi:hypothetical protein [Streptomyces sp. 12257]|uniref:hypothetical protein n=1 Tax=Streptomyces sp. 12257 TaxID=3041009 RepID=UPI00099EE604|nr:hypothetical protein [Streptomyces sp. 12257]MDI5907889.1 hypothetical protein [Streptomyces sp. 12257]